MTYHYLLLCLPNNKVLFIVMKGLVQLPIVLQPRVVWDRLGRHGKCLIKFFLPNCRKWRQDSCFRSKLLFGALTTRTWYFTERLAQMPSDFRSNRHSCHSKKIWLRNGRSNPIFIQHSGMYFLRQEASALLEGGWEVGRPRIHERNPPYFVYYNINIFSPLFCGIPWLTFTE